MATANSSSPFSYASDNPLAPEFLALERQKKMADLLLQKGQQQPQGEMVSGHYVAPSWAQQLNPLVNSYISGNLSQQNEAKTAELAKLLRGQNVTETQDILEKQFGSPDYKAAEMPQIQRDDLGQLMPPVNAQVGKAPNPQAALLAGLNATGPTGQAIGQTLLAQKLKPPELINVAQGATVGQRGPDGTFQKLYVNPKEETPSEAQKNYKLAQIQGYTGSFMEYEKIMHNLKAPRISVGGGSISGESGGVNNNGVSVGRYDKMGRYISPTGRVFPASAVTEAQKEHDAATALAYKLNQLDKKDITNAFGSLTDYSTSKLGRMAGPTKTLDAQVKINNLQIGSVLNNLSQLKGASSDKEMAQMIKDFPGYEASPNVMNNWVERASKTTNRFLKQSENRFGFDTEYAQENRFNEKPKEQKDEIAVSKAPKVNEIRQGYRFKGGDQYDKNNWVKVQ